MLLSRNVYMKMFDNNLIYGLWSCLPSEAVEAWKMCALLLLLCSDKNAQELCVITGPATYRLEAKNALAEQGYFFSPSYAIFFTMGCSFSSRQSLFSSLHVNISNEAGGFYTSMNCSWLSAK